MAAGAGGDDIVLYLSPVWHTIQPQNRDKFGYIVSLHTGAGAGAGVLAGHPWMLDNGAFSDKWIESAWLATLERWRPCAGTCIAAVAPDVVGDADATLARFAQYASIIKQYGYPVAFVTQDGLQMDAVPWGEFDVLFVGGTDAHKLKASYPFILEAQRRGVWVHVGRVNSARRIEEQFWMADSCDGTMLAVEPSPRRQSILLNASRVASAKKEMMTLL